MAGEELLQSAKSHMDYNDRLFVVEIPPSATWAGDWMMPRSGDWLLARRPSPPQTGPERASRAQTGRRTSQRPAKRDRL
jgi:hypothetical protein